VGILAVSLMFLTWSIQLFARLWSCREWSVLKIAHCYKNTSPFWDVLKS